MGRAKENNRQATMGKGTFFWMGETGVMKKVTQLNLTEEEALILQSIVMVGVAIHPLRKDLASFERDVRCMATFMDKWPASNESLADKMIDLVETSLEVLKVK